MGRRPQRHDPGADDRLPVVPLGPRGRDELHRQGGRRPVRRRAVHHELRAAVRHAGGLRRPGPVPGGIPVSRDRLGGRAAGELQPTQGDASPRAGLRRRQVRPQRLHLRQHERPDDELRQGPLLEDEERRRFRRHPQEGPVGRRQGQDRRRRPRRPDRRHAGQGRGSSRPTCPGFDCSTPPSAGRSPAGRRGPASPGSPATSPSSWRRSSRPRRPPTSRSSKPASPARRRTSSRASTGRPATRRCSDMWQRRTSRTSLMVGVPTTDEFQHQFLGLVSATLPGGAANPALRRRPPRMGSWTAGSRRVRASSGRPTAKADKTLTLARSLVGVGDPTTFVTSDHGFAPQFLAIDASQPLVELGLLSKPQTSNCRPATGETRGIRYRLLGRRHRPDLPQHHRARSRSTSGGGQCDSSPNGSPNPLFNLIRASTSGRGLLPMPR